MTAPSSPFRSGFVALVGRPNAGKSTLANALVGSKVAITSGRPQTTRRAIRGILNRPNAQVVLVDTPGVHRPRTLLGERLNELVADTLAEVDAVALCLPADQEIGPGDRFIEAQTADARRRLAVVTKADIVPKETLARALLAAGELADFDHIIPVSAVDGFQVAALADLLVSLMPEGPRLYGEDETTDEPVEIAIAELIREAALEGVRDELPHSLAVVVDEIEPGRGRGLVVRASLYVERDSQKGIVIGTRGIRLRDVGAAARPGIEAILDARVFLDLRVKVAKDWQRDPRQLRRLGF